MVEDLLKAASAMSLYPHKHSIGSSAYEPIIVSDDDDDDDVEEAAEDVEIDTDQDDSSNGGLQQLHSKYTYHSPTKASVLHRNAPVPPKVEPPKHRIPSERSVTASSSSSPAPSVKAAKRHASASTSKESDSAPPRKKARTVKPAQTTSVQLKKTLQIAEESGVAPLDLSQVSAAGFRLIGRCSFCASAFTKSASARVKQEHMSFCAPLNGIKKILTAIDLIKVDVQSAVERDEEMERKARQERTTLMEVVQEADVVLHEGRASQIAASPKKRGRDAVIIKKAIKRSTKPSLFLSDQDSNLHGSASSSNKHKLLPAREAMLAAREVANQLIGMAPESTTSNKEEDANSATVEPQSPDRSLTYATPDPGALTTPKKPREHTSTPLAESNPGQMDGGLEDRYNLPVVSMEQAFASIAATSPHKKSPVKALQKSRERQNSREGDLSGSSDGSGHGLGIPSADLPATQPFAPSKLAKRQQALDGHERPALFGAETTTRSLLDLVKDHPEVETNESKRKALDTGMDCNRVKKHKPLSANGSDVEHDRVSLKPTHRTRKQDADVKPGASSSSTIIDSDMDIDDQTVERALKAEHDNVNSPTTGKLQEQALSDTETHAARLKTKTDLIDAHLLPQDSADRLDQYSRMPKRDSDESMTKFDNAGSIEESDDDDDDSQSFLELLEPLEVPPEPVILHTYSLSESSPEDMENADAAATAYRNRRMLVACGGGSVTLAHRGKGSSSAAFSPISKQVDHSSPPDPEARQRSVSNSDPELLLITDDSCSSSPQP